MNCNDSRRLPTYGRDLWPLSADNVLSWWGFQAMHDIKENIVYSSKWQFRCISLKQVSWCDGLSFCARLVNAPPSPCDYPLASQTVPTCRVARRLARPRQRPCRRKQQQSLPAFCPWSHCNGVRPHRLEEAAYIRAEEVEPSRPECREADENVVVVLANVRKSSGAGLSDLRAC